MPLELGKSFDRHYSLRVPFLDGYYNIGVFFHKSSNFLLFRVDPDFMGHSQQSHGIKINMFKNLESSKFCETFLELHNYRGNNLDITNQFNKIKDDYYTDVVFTFNESINLSKYDYEGKTFYNTVMLYGLTLVGYEKEFLFIVTERQHIVAKLKKKIVRTTAVQLSTSQSIKVVDEFNREYKKSFMNRVQMPNIDTNKVIKLEDDKGDE